MVKMAKTNEGKKQGQKKQGKPTTKNPRVVDRKIRGEIRKMKIWYDSKGKRHQQVATHKITPAKKFEENYNAAIKQNKANLMARKIPDEVAGMMKASLLEQEEWSGGVDFEPGTRKAERVLFTRGRHDVDEEGSGYAYGPGDERVDFELKFHAHPSGKKKSGRGWNRGPSTQDMSLIKLDTPEVIVQLEPFGDPDKTGKQKTKKYLYLLRSLNKDPVPKQEIKKISDEARRSAETWATVSSQSKYYGSKMSDDEYRAIYWQAFYPKYHAKFKEGLNKIGLDMKKINHKEEKIYMTKDHQKDDARSINVVRMRDRRRGDDNKGKKFGKKKKIPNP